MNAAATLAGLPAFLLHFGVAIALLVAFCTIYVHATPYHEFALIKAGNTAAALAFGGAILSFCLPLHAALSNSVSVFDFAVWGAIALVVQLGVFFVLRLIFRDLPKRIAENQNAAGGFVAAVSLGVGLLNA